MGKVNEFYKKFYFEDFFIEKSNKFQNYMREEVLPVEKVDEKVKRLNFCVNNLVYS